MTDGVTPVCVYCGETIDLTDHLERLNAHQPFIEFMQGALPPGATFRAGTKCEACRADPERAYEAILAASDEELQARMRGPG